MRPSGPRRLLVIAEGFPPLGGSGVQRTLKFVKYLPEFGWQPAVLTGDPERDRPGELDRSLLPEIPEGTPILRLPFWNPAASVFRRLSPRRSGGPATFNSVATPTETSAPDGIGLIHQLFRSMRKLLTAPVADNFWYGNLRWRRAALRFCQATQASAIYVSGSPFSSMLLGLWIKRRTGLPLLVDFRDPWTLFNPERAVGLRFRINRHFERKILAGADAVVVVNNAMKSQFEQIQPRARGRIEVITNGFDAGDFASKPDRGTDTHALVHIGTVWEDGAQSILRALEALKSSNRLGDTFRLRFIGGLPPSALRSVASPPLSEVVKVEPRMSHAEAIRAMREATATLLLVSSKRHFSTVVPAKTFEYMAASRPVLCIAPNGPAADLIRESGCGIALHPEDSSGIGREVGELSRDPAGWQAKHFHPRATVVGYFDRRKQAGRLAEILERVTTCPEE